MAVPGSLNIHHSERLSKCHLKLRHYSREYTLRTILDTLLLMNRLGQRGDPKLRQQGEFAAEVFSALGATHLNCLIVREEDPS